MTYKKIITTTLLYIPCFIYSQNQTLKHGNEKRGSFTEYISKNQDTIKKGDTLVIGKASNHNKFVYIMQGGDYMHADHTNKKVTIKTIETFGRKNSGYSTYFSFKGFGILPVYVNYEAAIESGEIHLKKERKNPKKTLEELKHKKQLLDLGIISKEEYEKEIENYKNNQ